MFFKKKEEFMDFCSRIKKYLEKGNFDSAVARYTELEHKFKSLDEEKQEEYREEYESVVKQLLIYMKIRDLNVVIEGDDIELIKNSLNYLKDMQEDTPNIGAKYSNFISSKYSGFYNQYSYKLALAELNKALDNVYKLRDEQNYDLALQFFPEVMKKYRELEEYLPGKSQKIFKKLVDLREQLKLELVEFRAHSPVAEVNVETLRKSLKRKNLDSFR